MYNYPSIVILDGIVMSTIHSRKPARSSTPYGSCVEPGVDRQSVLKVYLSSVSPVLEYAVPVWQSIPNYLSDKIESIQKRALRIIFPSADNYNDALEVARLDTLSCRREKLCIEYMRKMKNLNHPLHHLLPTHVNVNKPYTLRHNSDQVHFYKNVSTCRTKRTEEFFAFKYF